MPTLYWGPWLAKIRRGGTVLLFEPPRLLIFKKISSLPVFSPTQMKFFPPYPLLLEPTRLINLKKNSSLPFY
jgi:hypothetical protein